MIKIYRGNNPNKELKTPMLSINKTGVVAVDDQGDVLAILIDLRTMVRPQLAETSLQLSGYRTDWAKWDDIGAFMGMLEPID
jgi:hypothetical protein